MTQWAHIMWNFLHTQSFFIDLHEHHGLVAQQAFIDLLMTLPSQLPCQECRAHLAAFLQTDPPPRPEAYEPEDYVYAQYIFRMHNSVNRRLRKPEPTFAAVVDRYVNDRQDVMCSSMSENSSGTGSGTQTSGGKGSGTLTSGGTGGETGDSTNLSKADDRDLLAHATSAGDSSDSTPTNNVNENSGKNGKNGKNGGCGIPDAAIPAVVCVAVMIFAVIILCSVLEFAGQRKETRLRREAPAQTRAGAN